MSHPGIFEQRRFQNRREKYNSYLKNLDETNLPIRDILEHFPAFVGQMTLSRAITFYELYKKTLGIAGHIADVGIYKGFSSILMSKLVQLNESESFTQVHGFDWFKGTGIDSVKQCVEPGSYQSDEKFLLELIQWQGLEDILLVHNIDLTSELDNFFNKAEHLMFKLVILDAGFYDVVSKSIPKFWERLTPGGIIVFDQYNHELSPGETIAVREFLPKIKIQTINNSWMPTAYAVKPFN